MQIPSLRLWLATRTLQRISSLKGQPQWGEEGEVVHGDDGRGRAIRKGLTREHKTLPESARKYWRAMLAKCEASSVRIGDGTLYRARERDREPGGE